MTGRRISSGSVLLCHGPARQEIAQVVNRGDAWGRVLLGGRDGPPGNRLELLDPVGGIVVEVPFAAEMDGALDAGGDPRCVITAFRPHLGDLILKGDVRSDREMEHDLNRSRGAFEGGFDGLEVESDDKAVAWRAQRARAA